MFKAGINMTFADYYPAKHYLKLRAWSPLQILCIIYAYAFGRAIFIVVFIVLSRLYPSQLFLLNIFLLRELCPNCALQ